MKNLLKAVVVAAITLEARAVLYRYRPKIAAITGNVGKTSAKDAIFTVFRGSLSVRKSEKSLNSETGVPLAILGCESGWNSAARWARNIIKGVGLAILPHSYPRWVILEVGADKPGDIQKIARWLKPDIVVLTGIPDIPVHLESFGSVDLLAQEKEALVKALPKDGFLVFNGDDRRARQIAERHDGLSVSYGFDPTSNFFADDAEIKYREDRPTGIDFRINRRNFSSRVEVNGALGRTQIYPVLAALAVGERVGLDVASMIKSLADYQTPPGRMRIIGGLKDSVIIDDSYNASPAATLSALETMAGLRSRGRKIAALGDMRELGRASPEAHRRVGRRAAEVVDLLLTVGEESRLLAEEAVKSGLARENVFQYGYNESARAGQDLKSMLRPGDLVLVKGSQNMIRLERLVKEIMAEPQRAEELLVRQEKDWLERP